MKKFIFTTTKVVVILVIALICFCFFACFKKQVTMQEQMEELSSLVATEEFEYAYYNLMESYADSIETIPYSIIMATEYKNPIAFVYIAKNLQRLYVKNGKKDTCLFNIARNVLEEGSKYDTVEQACLLTLIEISASEENVDSTRLKSYIGKLNGFKNDSASQSFLYYKVLEMYRKENK